MNILFYIEPWIERKNPNFRIGSFLHDLPTHQFVAKKDEKNYTNKFLVGDGVALALQKRDPDLYEQIQDDLIIVPEKRLRSFNDNYLQAQIDIFQDKLSDEQIAQYDALYKELLGDFVPDVILSWESPAEFFHYIYPDALILNIYHNSLFRFSKRQWGDRYILDPAPLNSTVMADVIENPNDYQSMIKGKEGIADIRQLFLENVKPEKKLLNKINNYQQQFSKLALVPLQGSHFNFEGNSPFNSQFDFVTYVLENVDPSVGVIVTEHHLLYGMDITPKNISYLQEKYPNIIYSTDFRVPHISTKFLPYVDAVITVSSTMAWSTRLLNKHVKVVGNSWYDKLSTTKLGEIHQLNEDAPNIDDVLAYLIYNFSVRYSDFNDANFITDYIENLYKKHKTREDFSQWFPSPENIAELEDGIFQTLENLSLNDDQMPFQMRDALDKIALAKVVSFDIFDTLLQRQTLFPTDVFKLMNREVNEIIGAPVKFKELRQLAEKLANERSPENYEDVNLDEIYLELERFGFNKEQAEKVKQLEIAWEKKMLVPRPTGQYLYEVAKTLNKPIVIASDMYLPASVLKEVLATNGYTDYDYFYVSSETRTKKHTTKLFYHILRDVDVEPQDIVHIGDNIHGDIQMSSKIGMKNIHIPAAIHNFFASPVNQVVWGDIKDLHRYSVYDRCALAMVVNKYYEKPWGLNKESLFNNDFEQAGYVAFGALSFDMTLWMYHEVAKNKNDGLAFIWRDGYIPLQLWQKIDDKIGLNKNVDTIALYGSHSLYTNWLLYQNPSSLYDYGATSKNIQFNKLLKSWFGMNEEEIARPLNINLDIHKPITNNQEYLKVLEEILENYPSYVTRHASDLERYYTEMIGSYHNVALFDIGYRGRAQTILSSIMQKPLDSFYLATFEEPMAPSEKVNMRSYFSESITSQHAGYYHHGLNPILEMVISDPNPSVRSITYNDDGEPVFKYKNNDISSNVEAIEQMHNGINEFTDDFITAFGSELPYVRLSRGFTTKILYYLAYAQKDFDLWQKIIFPNDISQENIQCGTFYVNHHNDKNLCLAFDKAPPSPKTPPPSVEPVLIKPDVRGLKKLISRDYISYKRKKILAKRFNNQKPTRPKTNKKSKFLSLRYYNYCKNKWIYNLLKDE